MRNRVLVLNVVGISLISCIIFHLVIEYGKLSYNFGALAKILLFGFGAFGIYYILNKENPFKLLLGDINLGYIGKSLVIGFGVLLIVWLAYFFTKSLINLNVISKELLNNGSIDKGSFPYVALYITVGNSFLEELFFRGFIFLQIYEKGYKKLAYVFSSVLFAFYHVTLIQNWFSPLIIILCLIGLFFGGIIFNVLTVKSKNILNPWIVHVLANVAIVSIGVAMFYF